MAILKGSVSARRYRVVGSVGADFTSTMDSRLNDFAFVERIVETGKEESEGWVSIHNLLDCNFDDDASWLYGRFAMFALRVDKKRLPPNLFKATLDKRCQDWAVEHRSDVVPRDIKDELKFALEDEWLKRVLPRVAITEIVWNLVDGDLLVHSTSESTCERVKKRFLRTFGLELVAVSPLEWVEDDDLQNKLIASTPSLFDGGAL